MPPKRSGAHGNEKPAATTKTAPKAERDEKSHEKIRQKRKAPEPDLQSSKRNRKTPLDHKDPTIKNDDTSSNSRIKKLVSAYGTLPLSDVGLDDPAKATPETVLAHIFNALLSSARISHNAAAKTVRCLIKAGYHDLETLKASSWDERTRVLTEGGYTRYREKTATALGDLASLLEEKYETTRKELSIRLKEIKGIGDVGSEIFLSSIQWLWPTVAPYMNSRNVKTAAEISIGSDIAAIYKQLNEDAAQMAKLDTSLTRARLDGKIKEFL
ncbi:MAG: hypothetical protein Q9227_002139 [Pyrenula ochraceoflavens]